MPRTPKGERWGGRAKGTPNKRTVELEERLRSLGCDPFELMALIATNKLPCGVCRGKLRTPYKLPDGSVGQRTCESCYGVGLEKCAPELRGKMAAEIAQYIQPKRKAVEMAVTGADGVPLSIAVRFIGAPEATPLPPSEKD